MRRLLLPLIALFCLGFIWPMSAMAGPLIIAGAGAAIGWGLFGTTFALGVGWMLGSAIGGALFAPDIPTQHIEGAALADLKVTGVDYGQPIPWVRGTPRIAGQIWWASIRRKIAHTTTSGGGGGGKGGGGDGGGGSAPVEQTTYTYDVDLLIGLPDCEIDGVSRVWENGKLVSINQGFIPSIGPGGEGFLYNVLSSITASESTPRWDRMTVYNGTTTQMPDPTYEAAVGTANAPAYRGRGYVFIQNYHLGQSGAIGNLTFEIRAGNTLVFAEAATYTEFSAAGEPDLNPSGCVIDRVRNQVWKCAPNSGVLSVLDIASGVVTAYNIGGPTVDLLLDQDNDILLISPGASGTGRKFNLATRTASAFDHGLFIKCSGGGSYVSDDGTGNMRVRSISTGAPSFLFSGPNNTNSEHGCYDGVGNYYVGTGSGIRKFTTSSQTLIYATATPNTNITHDPGRRCLYFLETISGNRALRKLDLASLAVSTVIASLGNTYYETAFYDAATDSIALGAINSRCQVRNALDWSLVDEIAAGSFNGPVLAYKDAIVYGNGPGLPPSGDAGSIIKVVFGTLRFDTKLNAVGVDEAVSDLCLRAGMTADQFDVTALQSITKPVRALTVSQIAPTRSTLEMLMGAYFFEMTVSDKIYFRPRGSAAVATIPYLDLGATQGDEPAEPLALKQRTDIELPARIALTYADIDNDYQNATVLSDRLVTAVSDTVLAVQIPMGFTSAEAKGIADTMLLDMQVALTSTKIALLGDYARLEPTDEVIATAADGGTFRLRLLKKTDAYPLLEFDAVLDDASVLIHEGITSADYTPSTSVVAPAETLMELMDIPILRDADNNAGFYVAAKGDGEPWGGADIDGSADDVTYIREGVINISAIFGTCSTTLGDWTGPRVFDEKNLVTVDVVAGTLSSLTRDEILASQAANAMLIGSEVIQFRDASLVTTGVYILSGLLRGGRGTEWAMTGHVASERCVRLQQAGLTRIIRQTADLGVSRFYKGVTAGRSVATATPESFIDNGIGLKPFSPFDLRATRDGSDNITFTWQRRTRLSVRTSGPLGISVPLGEESEAYDVQIYDGSGYATLKRTITATTTTCAYSAADQTTDFGSAQATVYTRVYQRSAQVGLGYKLEAFA